MLKFEHINEIVARCVRSIVQKDEKEETHILYNWEKNMVDRLLLKDELNKEMDINHENNRKIINYSLILCL